MFITMFNSNDQITGYIRIAAIPVHLYGFPFGRGVWSWTHPHNKSRTQPGCQHNPHVINGVSAIVNDPPDGSAMWCRYQKGRHEKSLKECRYTVIRIHVGGHIVKTNPEKIETRRIIAIHSIRLDYGV